MPQSNEAIPAEDVIDVYLKADHDTQVAVSNILFSEGNFMVAGFAGTTPSGQPLVTVSWKSNETLSLLLATILIKVGKQRHGEIWLKSLVEQISHLE